MPGTLGADRADAAGVATLAGEMQERARTTLPLLATRPCCPVVLVDCELKSGSRMAHCPVPEIKV